jgi:glucose-6-phosphate dehydrogenase assembly protein OpcA
VSRTVSGGPGITEAEFTTIDGDINITRYDGRTATLAWPGRTDRRVALHRRDTAELLAEELRRLDPDEVYAETLRHSEVYEPPGVDEEAAEGAAEAAVDEVAEEYGE